MNGFSHYMFAGFGNPLLDMSVTGNLDKILLKYNLSVDGQKEVDEDQFNDMIATIKRARCGISYNPGGCVLNTLRIIQALVKHPSSCVFFGGLGNDKAGEFLESEIRRCGLEARFARHSSLPTGRVVALIKEDSRSLVAHLGAAHQYSLEDFLTPENLQLFEDVSVVYTEGFFITHSFKVGLEVAHLCRKKGVAVVFNISGAYVAEKCPTELLAMVTAADIVIGNANEFRALAKTMYIKFNDIVELALEIHSKLSTENPPQKLKLKQTEELGKVVIVTQGKNPVVCVYGNGNVITHEVPFLDPKLVKDCTGAGDAFAAGFITALLKDSFVEGCLNYGCKIAQEVIQHTGVQPEKLDCVQAKLE